MATVGDVCVLKRPGLDAFLEHTARFFKLVVYSAGAPEYVRKIVRHLDPTGSIFSDDAIFTREHCLSLPCGGISKDLRLVSSEMHRIVLVDDSPTNFICNVHNGIPVLPFRAEPNDWLLLGHLLPFLCMLDSVPDVRPVLKTYFGVDQFVKSL